MKFLIDTSPAKMQDLIDHQLVCGQLLTPLTQYADYGGPYGVDTGAFSRFPEETFNRLLIRQERSGQLRLQDCLFVTCPDIVGSARRTLELWRHRELWFGERAPHWKNRLALVAQDGMEDLDIPWDEIHALFVGGRDPWKDSQAAADIVKTAKILRKHTHAGRVNTARRFKHFDELGVDTCDGSGVAKYDHMLKSILRSMKPEPRLFDSEDE